MPLGWIHASLERLHYVVSLVNLSGQGLCGGQVTDVMSCVRRRRGGRRNRPFVPFTSDGRLER